MNTINETAVSVTGLEKRFGAFVAVNKVNFEVKKGEIFGFLGPNGAGKSTTIRMLCGIITPTSGKGQVGGFDIMTEQEKIKQNIGYMSQKFSLYDDLTVEENIDFYSGIYKIPKAEKKERKEHVLEIAGIGEFRHKLTRTLSGGWKQRLALGCAIIHRPRIIFLDEPTSGVDPITRGNFWAVINEMAENGITVFVTTHYMEEAENCGRVALVYKGNIIAMGTPEEMKTKFMENDIIKIKSDKAEEMLEEIGRAKGVREAALFGASVHAVSFDAAVSIPDIENILRSSGAENISVEKIKPSLEDVFVSLIENYDSKNKNA